MQSGITEQGDGSETRISALLGIGPRRRTRQRHAVRRRARAASRREFSSAIASFYQMAGQDPGSHDRRRSAERLVLRADRRQPSARVRWTLFFAGYSGVNNATAFFLNPDGTLFMNTLVSGDPASSAICYTGPMNGIKRIDAGPARAAGKLAESVQPARSDSPRCSDAATSRSAGQAQPVRAGQLQLVWKSSLWPIPARQPTRRSTRRCRGTRLIRCRELAVLSAARLQTTTRRAIPGLTVISTSQAYAASAVKSNVYQVLAGLQGELPSSDWTWETYISTAKRACSATSPTVGCRARLS